MNPNSEESSPELDLDVLFSEAEASVGEAAEPETDDEGPEQGELSEGEVEDAGDEDSEEDGDADLEAADDDAAEEDDETSEDEDESDEDDDADADDDQDDEPTDPRLLELERKLEAQALQAEQLQAQNQQLLQLLGQGAVPRQQPQQQRDPEFEAAWKAAHVSGADGLEGYSPEVKQKVSTLAQQLAEARAHWALNPEDEYRTRFEPLVQQAIQEAIRPFMETRKERALESVLAPHRDFLDQHRELVVANLPPTFGASNPDDPTVMRQRLEVAVKLAKAKLAEGGLRKREQRVKTKSRQQDAKRRSRKQSSRKPRKAPVKAPKLKSVDPDDLSAYAAELAANPALLDQAEAELRS